MELKNIPLGVDMHSIQSLLHARKLFIPFYQLSSSCVTKIHGLYLKIPYKGTPLQIRKPHKVEPIQPGQQ